ncbi:MAG: CBS domain-containing protein [Candidatus Helarchaeota archaeon]|nr:CBS domain-containing protein [Candidatus Helarchaeota archaeon]
MEERQKLLVRDVMNHKVQVLTSAARVQEAAKIMRDKAIGSIVIVDPEDKQKPIGIITERDMNNRIVAENKVPSEVVCKEIISTPVSSISPKVLITEAMRQMATQNIKRLIVMEKQKMVGIISESDILRIAPSMIEILQEKVQLGKEQFKTEYLAGYCQQCRSWSDMLEEMDEIYVCQECKTTEGSAFL